MHACMIQELIFHTLTFYLQVNGVYLSSADHELAVQAIQRSGNPIRFVVQSLQHMVSMEDNYVECLDAVDH